jgi:hypothetical protein
MYVPESDRYPEAVPPDPFVWAAHLLCGEEPRITPLWSRTRRHPHDVARDALKLQVLKITQARRLCALGGRSHLDVWRGYGAPA